MTPGYSRLQIWLHWGIAALILIAFFSHEAMNAAWQAVGRGAEPAFGYQIHIVAGLAVLALVILRLAVRLIRGVPPPPEGGPLLVQAGRAMHWLLYGILVILPVAGASAWFLGLRTAAEAHEVLFSIGLGLVLLHSLAALFHHYVLRDGLITRMIRAR